MSPIQNLRTSLAYVLICSLFLTGLITLTTRQSHASDTSLPHSLTPSVDESSEKSMPQAETVDEATRTRVSQAFGKLPLSFEENRGQVDNEVKYVSRGSGYTLFLTSTEAVLTLRKADKVGRHEKQARDLSNPQSARPQASVLRMKLRGANSAPVVTGESEMGARANYFVGNDPAKWHTGVARYERVRYEQVYPGVDMIYYGQQQQLEYDFEVAPGADARRIALEFTGVRRVQVERGTGDLLLKTTSGEVRQRKPVAYQEVGGARREVETWYVLKGKGQVGIEVGEYDRTQRLVIDPILGYSTYLGGNGDDRGFAIAVDSAGHAYVTGYTASFNFPTLDQFQGAQGNKDAFVTKLDTNASGVASLLYSTYLGGSDDDYGQGIAVDSTGHAYVTGFTRSSNFPTLHAYKTDPESAEAFVTKLDTNASGAASLLYSTYLGGSEGEGGNGIAVDSAGHVYVTGVTTSDDFPTLHEYQMSQGLFNYDAFITKLDPNASGAASLLYSTYLGGSEQDYGQAIAVDSAGHAYVTGYTYSSDFPTLHQYQTQGRYYTDAFVTKLDTNASGAASLLYSTYLGGDTRDYGYGIAVDSAGHAYVTGMTDSDNFPTKNGYQRVCCKDAFVTKLDTNASGADSLLYSTYLGGRGSDYGYGIAVDSAGHAYVTGFTHSTDFPTKYPYQTHREDDLVDDAFIAKLDTNLSGTASLLYSTYLGGDGQDIGQGIAVDSAGHAYVTGHTYSMDFPTRNQYPTRQAVYHAFVTKFSETFIISGKVTTETVGGAGLPGASVTLISDAGFTPRSVTTASDGTYSFAGVPVISNYTLKASKTNYAFRPAQLILTNVTANQINKNFVATKAYTISGTVKLGAAGLSGVTVKLTSPTPAGFTTRTTTTSSNGTYSFTNVPANRDYTLTPTKTGYQFTPVNKTLSNLTTSQVVNFAVKVYSITGRITRPGTTTSISAVTVTLTSPTPAGFAARTVQTTSTGTYTFTNVPAGRNYTIKPTKTGFTFTPATRSITNLSSNIAAGASTNFTGTGP